jgi:hypothetical protein
MVREQEEYTCLAMAREDAQQKVRVLVMVTQQEAEMPRMAWNRQ